ncbi:lamin tail domain-containing protein [Oceanobacillus kapialis]|uniref:Lamin tail domain-containing protein n=2 Tax=Bacillati TaxID=1783272 RepID=A0ABW5Q2A5_9BACI
MKKKRVHSFFAAITAVLLFVSTLLQTSSVAFAAVQQPKDKSIEQKQGTDDAEAPATSKKENTKDTSSQTNSLTFQHEQPSSFSDLKSHDITVNIPNAENAQLHYKATEHSMPKRIEMHESEKATFTATIPKDALWSEKVSYWFTSTNTEKESESNVYTVKVDKQADREDTNAPKLFITEASLTGETFVEVYNNTNQALNLQKYSLLIGKEEVSFPEDRKLAPQETIVIWFTENDATLSTFNDHYSTTLQEEELFIVEETTFAKDVPLKLVDKQSTRDISTVIYSASEAASQLYYYSKGEIEFGGETEVANPGSLVTDQVPEQPLTIKSDTTEGTETNESKDEPSSNKEATSTPVEKSPSNVEQGEKEAEAKSRSVTQAVEQVIEHQPITEVDGQTDLTVEASVGGATEVKIQYQTGEGMVGQELALTQEEGTNVYTASISKEQLWSPHFGYRIVAEMEDGTSISLPEEGHFEAKVIPPEVSDTQEIPQLLITEITPDTSNQNGADAYEFIEIYNNSSQPINMQDYQVIYRYPSNTADQIWELTDNKVIQPQESFIVWIKNDGNQALELADFNTQYGIDMPESHVTEIQSSGMANGSERSLIVSDKFSNEIVAASYNDEAGDDTKANQGIVYTYPQQGKIMKKVGIGETVTPLSIVEGQTPRKPVVIDEEDEVPVIGSPEFSITEDGIKVDVKITSEQEIHGVNVSVQQSEEVAFQTWNMEVSNSDPSIYTITIPREEIWSDRVTYFITAGNLVGETSTEPAEKEIPGQPIDYQKVPSLLITEVVPDTSNENGADGYEFIEVYNNTTETIDFNDYTLRYRYPNSGPAGDLLWGPQDDQQVMIPSGESVVFWVINQGNPDKGQADFNANFNTNLIEGENLFKIYNNGMANGSERTLVMATKTGTELSYAMYNEEAGIDDTVQNKGIFYRYPTDGGLYSTKISSTEWDATPGSVMPEQVPAEKVQLPDDSEPPLVEDTTTTGSITSEDSVTLSAMITDQIGAKSVFLYYRTQDNDDFRQVSLERQDDNHYAHLVYEPELIGKSELEYYFVASDGKNKTTTEPNTLQIENPSMEEGLRLNVKDGDLLAGESTIKATTDEYSTDTEVYVDDQQVTDTFKAMETEAYFAFDVTETNIYFKNGVTMGDEVLEIFDDTYTDFTTLTVPVSADKLQVGENTITIRAGNKVGPFDETSHENRDDFTIRNIRLVLSDGTTIYDPDFADPEQNYPVGDSSGKDPIYNFNFTLEEEQFTSTAYLFDTSNVEDGEHTIKAVHENEEVSAKVVTDNTSPVLNPTVEEGETYKGDFVIDAEANDPGSGIEEVTAQLDGDHISLPYETSSALLEAGKHEIIFRATDLAGNTQEEVIQFEVVKEHPLLPDWLSNDPESTRANLSVTVNDPTEDKMDVAFYESYQYTAEDPNLVISENAVDSEPPSGYLPEGEARLTDEQREALEEIDGNELSTESDLQFPYHRFDVTVDENVDANDEIEVVWDGSSLPGRKVTMYAWNYASNSWDALTSTIAGEEAFQLVGSVSGAEYVQDHKVSVIVQDQIADVGEDFSFVWMADTQYYSESYPHIYEQQVNWIAENQQEHNIEYVFHSGDLVNIHDDFEQWDVADRSMRVLDEAGVPYGVVAGNHDVNNKQRYYDNYSQFFGEDRFEGKSYYGESFQDNRGHYDLISVNGMDFIMVHLGWGIEEEGIEWLNEVLEAHPNRKAILNVHEYLLATGNRSPTGDLLFEEVVIPNENVIAVLCGHYHNAQTLTDEVDDNGDGIPDRTVYQMLADYQGGPEGGQGYLRILNFNMDENKIDVETYSPYLDDYNYYEPTEYPEKDEFSLDYNMEAQTKKVATDHIEVNVYTDELIGEVTGVPSGETAAVTWSNLDPNSEYFWFVEATDEFGGQQRSDIWNFRTVDGEIVEPEIPEEPEGPQDPNEGNNGENEETPGDPQDPENEERPNVQDPSADNDQDSGNDENNQLENDRNTNDNQPGIENTTNNGENNDGSDLPETATNMYHYILLGTIILLSGISIWIASYYRKRHVYLN